MAKIHYSDFVEGLDAAATLDGTELIAGIQDGVPVKMTTQDVADLGGGAAASVITKTADFTANDASGTVYINDGAGDAITATLGNSAAGTEYTFIGYPTGSNFYIVPAADISIKAFNLSANQPVSIVGGDGFAFDVTTEYGSIRLVKTDSATWVVISHTSSIEAVEP